MSLAIGIIGVLAGLAGALMLGSAYTLLGPLVAFAIAMILGGVVALIGKKVVGMKIPILVQCTVELSGAAALSVLGFSAAIAGSYAMPAILTTVISTGFIGLLFILNTMAIQHPFNACLGPNEDQSKNPKTRSNHSFHVHGDNRTTWNRIFQCMVGNIHNWCNRMVYINESLFTGITRKCSIS